MTREFNYDAIISFAVFADKLNFTRAAEQLHISQPALHMKIQELTAALGVPLYRKNGRQLELTEQGKRVARFARDINSRTQSFLHELETGNDKQQVILAAGEGAYLYILGDAIRDFLKQPNIKLKLLTLNRDEVIDAIQTGKAHLGVASLETIPEGFQSQLLTKSEQVLVMPRKHSLAAKKRIRLNDLAGMKLIVPPADRPHRQTLAAALQSAGVPWEVAVEAAGWELMMHFVKLGLGVAVVNSICDIPTGLVARPLNELPRIHYHIFHLSGSANSGSVAELKKLLLTKVEK